MGVEKFMTKNFCGRQSVLPQKTKQFEMHFCGFKLQYRVWAMRISTNVNKYPRKSADSKVILQ